MEYILETNNLTKIYGQNVAARDGGLVGIINNLPTDENSITALIEEMNELSKHNE